MGVFAGVEKNWAALTDIGRTHVATKGIVQSGLVLNLDAGVSSSYSGSGTSWTDLSSSANNATLVNGPTYTSDAGGGIVFDGIDDGATFASSPSLTNGLTLEVFGKFTFTSSGNVFAVGRDSAYRILVSSSFITGVISTTNNSWYSAGTTVGADASLVIGNDCQIVVTYNGSINKLYLNGALANTASSNISGNVTTVNNYTIGLNGALIAPLKGTLRINRVYNRALSDSEISQNFNAMRYRFGI